MINFFHIKAVSVLLVLSDLNDEIMKYRAVSKLNGPVGSLVTNIGS